MTDDTLHSLEQRLRREAPTGSADPPPVHEAARAAGLADVAYATLDSPVGELLLARTDAGLVRIAYIDGEDAWGSDAVLSDLAARLSPRVLAAPAALDAPRRELDEWFAGRRETFDVAVDWSLMSAFTRRVLHATAAIPYGESSTYGAVAAAAGSPRGSRAAGNALGANPLPIVIPCHRVRHASGGLGGYTGGLERKRALLAVESGARGCDPEPVG